MEFYLKEQSNFLKGFLLFQKKSHRLLLTIVYTKVCEENLTHFTLILFFHITKSCVIKTLPRFSSNDSQNKFNVTSDNHDISAIFKNGFTLKMADLSLIFIKIQ